MTSKNLNLRNLEYSPTKSIALEKLIKSFNAFIIDAVRISPHLNKSAYWSATGFVMSAHGPFKRQAR
jgi:hypothetical protein